MISTDDLNRRLSALETEITSIRSDRDRLKEVVLDLLESVHPFPELSEREYAGIVAAGPSTALLDIITDAERELADSAA